MKMFMGNWKHFCARQVIGCAMISSRATTLWFFDSLVTCEVVIGVAQMTGQAVGGHPTVSYYRGVRWVGMGQIGYPISALLTRHARERTSYCCHSPSLSTV